MHHGAVQVYKNTHGTATRHGACSWMQHNFETSEAIAVLKASAHQHSNKSFVSKPTVTVVERACDNKTLLSLGANECGKIPSSYFLGINSQKKNWRGRRKRKKKRAGEQKGSNFKNFTSHSRQSVLYSGSPVVSLYLTKEVYLFVNEHLRCRR